MERDTQQETSSKFPCWLTPQGGREASWSPLWGKGRGGPRVQPEGWLRWPAHPFGGVCRRHAQNPAFAPNTLLLHSVLQQWQLGVVVFLYLVVPNLPQLHRHAVIFSPLAFLCILCLREVLVQMQALQPLQPRVPGPSLSQLFQLKGVRCVI